MDELGGEGPSRALAPYLRLWHGPAMRSRSARAAFVLSLVTLSAQGLGCGAAAPTGGRTARPRPTLTAKPNPEATRAPEGPALLPSHVVARLDDENTAPYVTRRGDDVLLFFNARGRLFTRLCDAEGAPKAAEPVDVGLAPSEMPAAAIEAVGDGYLAAWVDVQKGNATLKALALDASGRAKGAPVALAQSADEVSWIEIIAGKTSALVVWEVPREDHFDVLAAPVTPGQTPSPAVVLAHDALAWDVVATERGGGIATIVPASDTTAAKAEHESLGRVLFAEVDFNGKVSTPVTLSAEPTAQNDVEVARAGKNVIVAWTDVRDIDANVYLAAVSPSGNLVSPPKRATAPMGEQALVSIVSGKGAAGHALLAWEDSLRAPSEGRLIHLANVGEDGTLRKARATLAFSANGPPDIAADGDGFAVMTLAPASQGEGPIPEGAPIWPSFVRFDKDLVVRASEPVRAEPFAATEGVPYLTRSLSCHGATCTTLSSSSGSPSTLAMVGLPIRQSPWRAPASLDAPEVPPYPRSVTALYDGEHLAKVASAEQPGGGALVGWVTYFIENNDAAGGKPASKNEPLATASVRAVSADGVPGKTTVLSQRALSIGGVAIAAAPGGKAQESAMVWVAREKNEAQVQITKLGPTGEKLAQKALTTVARKASKDGVPSEVSDVAVAYAPAGDPGKGSDDGWVVAWVDTRDGNAEVYAARVDRTLRKVVTDRRITDAPGDSAEVQIVVRGKETILVWSDARQSPGEGNGDIHAVRLDTRTLQKVGPEVRLFASAAHSRSPSAALAGDRVVVGWIEEPNPDAKGDETDAGVRIAVLDERGQLAGSPRLVHGQDRSAVTSIALACTSSRCRGVLTSAVRETMMLDAFELAPGAPPGPLKPLVALTGGVSADVSPSFSSSAATSLFFGDDAQSGTGRVRYMTLAW